MTSRDEPRPERRREGVAVSTGIGIGRAYLVGSDTINAPKHHIAEDESEDEVARLRRAIASADKQLAKIKAKLASDHESDYHIISAHQMMLHDEHLVGAAESFVRAEKICAEWALRRAADEVREVFDAIEDEYFRERKSDIEFVTQRVLGILVGRDVRPIHPNPDAIVVAYDLSPADTAQLHKAAIAGLITDAGGRTSHTAIIARAHEIPAVVGLEDASELIESDDLIIVDGTNGVVIINPLPATVLEYRELQRKEAADDAALLSNRDLPAQTRDGVAITLLANIDGPAEADGAREYGARGVGLTRTEYLFMSAEAMPSEEDHYRAAVAIVEKMGRLPVTLRTFDLGSDKLSRFLDASIEEANPALGLRSIRMCLSEVGLPAFRKQLRGLLRATAHGNTRLMFPMISGIEELRDAKAVLEEVKEGLRAEGIPFDQDVKVGIMVEMPAAVVIADLLAKECDFFSIGTNDLIQYTMAVDRVNELVSYLYEPLHPAILRLIKMTVDAARDAGIPVTVCGEMAGDPLLAPVLLGLGITELSMSGVSIPEVKNVVRQLAMSDLRMLGARLVQLTSVDDVRQAVVEELGRLGIAVV